MSGVSKCAGFAKYLGPVYQGVWDVFLKTPDVHRIFALFVTLDLPSTTAPPLQEHRIPTSFSAREDPVKHTER